MTGPRGSPRAGRQACVRSAGSGLPSEWFTACTGARNVRRRLYGSRQEKPKHEQSVISEEARLLMQEYDRAWSKLGHSTKVAEALELTPEQHYEIAAWREMGAQRVVNRLWARES